MGAGGAGFSCFREQGALASGVANKSNSESALGGTPVLCMWAVEIQMIGK